MWYNILKQETFDPIEEVTMSKRITPAILAVILIVCALIAAGDILGGGGNVLPEPDPGAEAEKLAAEPDEPVVPGTVPESVEELKPEKKERPPKAVVDEGERIEKALEEYVRINPEVMGWIYVPETDIDYPFVLGADNDYYLNHSPERNYSALGAIFEDFENHPDIDDNRNTVLYGHNVWYGGMFHDVEKFLDEEFFNKMIPIYLYTPKKVYVYEPFTIFEASYDYQYFQVDFKDDEEYVAFMREMRDNSRFPQDIDFTADDRMLTLSTCTNGAKTQRWSFQARLVETVDIADWVYMIFKDSVVPEKRIAPEGCAVS